MGMCVFVCLRVHVVFKRSVFMGMCVFVWLCVCMYNYHIAHIY